MSDDDIRRRALQDALDAQPRRNGTAPVVVDTEPIAREVAAALSVERPAPDLTKLEAMVASLLDAIADQAAAIDRLIATLAKPKPERTATVVHPNGFESKIVVK